jgi:quinoprotein glucose dehydrogenase
MVLINSGFEATRARLGHSHLQDVATSMKPYSFAIVFILVAVAGAAHAAAEAIDPPPPPREPSIAAASDEPVKAAAGFGMPAGFAVELFAAEPDVANPVAFSIDERGRVFVCEAFRAAKGVGDNNGNQTAGWLEADLAAKTVDDRLAYHLRLLGEKARDWIIETDRLRELVDADGDGRADRSTVYATGFNRLIEGHGAGVLARRGDVSYACIPNLWRMRDTDGDGVADIRDVLHTGYGVRVAFHGHDLHGLTLGPDGMIYFTIGDRGYHVVHEGRTLADPESGAVFRCEPDGSRLEVVHTGLRNPQELAFDDLGNLFTVDNNCDSGDRARLVQIVPGGDSGWRMSVQYLPDRGPFNRERIWHLAHDGQPAWIVPPLAHIGSGPSGFTAYPGTGLPPHFDGRFFLADFRGAAANSSVRTFRVQPKGASFEATDEEETFKHVLATDVEIGPDGAVWVSDWVHGWEGEGKGRLWRFVPTPESAEAVVARSAVVNEVRTLLAGDWSAVAVDRLVALLSHPDRRLRLEAQWELASRGAAGSLQGVLADSAAAPLARVHAIQGLTQIARRGGAATAASATGVATAFAAALADPDWRIRLVAARSLGDLGGAGATAQQTPRLTQLLADEHAHVRAAAAIALGRIATRDPAGSLLEPLTTAIRREASRPGGFDPHARHALVMAVAGVADAEALKRLAIDADPAVRLAACLVMRRHGDPAIAGLLDDADPRIVVEAARAIHDLPIPAATAALAARLDAPLIDGPDGDALTRRSIAACERSGTAADAARLTRFIARPEAPLDRRLEAVAVLRGWSQPPALERVLGMWRPFPEPRDAAVARQALEAALPEILAVASDRSPANEKLRTAVLDAAAALNVLGVGRLLAAECEDPRSDPATRASALVALAAADGAAARPLAERLSHDREPEVRIQARRVRARAEHDGRLAAEPAAELASELAAVCATPAATEPQLREQQDAIDLLATLDARAAARAVEQLAARLAAGELDGRLALEVIEARDVKAGKNASPAAATPASPAAATELAAELLAGGDVARGRELFFRRASLECVRCHRAEGTGGDVGPRLDGIAARRDRAYLLESIVRPSSQFADGYRTTVVITDDGRTLAGILKSETPDDLVIMTADGRSHRIPTASIEDRSEGASAMPADLATKLTSRELRDLVEWLASLR